MMKTYEVFFTPDAIMDLRNIYKYIAAESDSLYVVKAYIHRLQEKCEGLKIAPLRGRQRNDIYPNLRILALDRKAVAAFEVEEKLLRVLILNIFYGGQDYETLMRNKD